jgi:hypothetical protein
MAEMTAFARAAILRERGPVRKPSRRAIHAAPQNRRASGGNRTRFGAVFKRWLPY